MIFSREVHKNVVVQKIHVVIIGKNLKSIDESKYWIVYETGLFAFLFEFNEDKI